MKFHIEIDCDNDAFVEDLRHELITLLAKIVSQVAIREMGSSITDSNGNRVGRCWFELPDLGNIDDRARAASICEGGGDRVFVNLRSEWGTARSPLGEIAK